jgi:tRNA(Ile)-lysidine synthase
MRFYFPSKKNYQNHFVAFSGGVDSVVLAHRLSKALNAIKKKPILLHHVHSHDPYAIEALDFSKSFADDMGFEIIVEVCTELKPPKTSMEEFWRNTRYAFLDKYSQDGCVSIGHNLDDALETWIHSSFHGQPKVIQYQRKPSQVRPLIFASKKDILEYANKNNLTWWQDPTNSMDYSKMRNYVRGEVVCHAEVVNPGIRKMISKKIENGVDKTW